MQFGSLEEKKSYSRHVLVRRARVSALVLLAMLVGWLLITGDARWNTPSVHASGISESSATETGAQAPSTKPIINVNFNKLLAKVPRDTFGIWLGNSGHIRPDPMYLYRTPAGKAKLAEIGAKHLFYSTDGDNWNAPYSSFTAVPITYPDWMNTDEYLDLNADIGSSPMLAANITITCKQADVTLPPSIQNVTCQKAKPAAAVTWINYLKSIDAPVKYVVLGAEPYAGCIYWKKGINCTDNAGHHRIALTQDEYAARVIKWAKKLKKANPKLLIGANVRPNTFLCKNSATLSESAVDTEDLDLSSERAAALCGGRSWDQTVMEVAGDSIDFFVVHQYFVIREPAKTEADAQKLSYYKEQIDVRVQKQGVTAFPAQIRKELNQWLPAKIGAPIVVSEFNASYIGKGTDADKYLARQSLYTAMAAGSLYLDLLKPVNTPQGKKPGAAHAVYLGMFAPQLTMTRMLDPLDPNSIIYTPTWHVFSMLKTIPGKTLVKTKVTNNRKTAVNRPALNVTAVKKGKKATIVVFNHHSAAIKADVAFAGLTPLSATATQLGHNATGFLAMNDEIQPSAMTPETSVIPANKIKPTKLRGIKFPPHSITVLEVQGQ